MPAIKPWKIEKHGSPDVKLYSVLFEALLKGIIKVTIRPITEKPRWSQPISLYHMDHLPCFEL